MRKLLNGLYNLSGALAAGLIAAICLLVTAQVVLNLIAKIGGATVSMTIPSYASFAGYFLAASSFLALAYTFTNGGHIRVTLVLNKLGEGRARNAAEIISLLLAAMTSVFITYFLVTLLEESYRFGDKSTGIIAIPLWIPQLAVAIGSVIFSIAIIDVLIQTIRKGGPVVDYKETL